MAGDARLCVSRLGPSSSRDARRRWTRRQRGSPRWSSCAGSACHPRRPSADQVDGIPSTCRQLVAVCAALMNTAWDRYPDNPVTPVAATGLARMATLLHVTNLMRSIRTRAHLPRDGGGPCPGCPSGFCVAVRVVHTRTTLASSGGPPGTDVSWRSPRPRRTRPVADWTSSPSRSSGTAADPPNENTSFLPHRPVCVTPDAVRGGSHRPLQPHRPRVHLACCGRLHVFHTASVPESILNLCYPTLLFSSNPRWGGGLVLVFC